MNLNLFETNTDHNDEQNLDSDFFVNIIVPRPIPEFLIYSVPKDFLPDIKPGIRVIIPLGNTKFITGIIVNLHQKKPSHSTKDILEIIDKQPILHIDTQVPFFEWIARYYMCTLGEVCNAALPSALKMSSESCVQIHPAFDGDCEKLSVEELDFLSIISKKQTVSLNEFSSFFDKKALQIILKSLLQKEVIIVYEQVKDKYSPKILKKIKLSADFCTEKDIQILIKSLEKNCKQLDVLLHYISISNKIYGVGQYDFVEKSLFNKETISLSSFNTLIKKRVFIEKDFIISRFASFSRELRDLPLLTPAQSDVLSTINKDFATKDIVLLHGLTGSGKTEIYISLISEAIKNGKRVLYLLPEIAITTQLISRLMKFFGEKLGVYHSKYSDQERAEIWHNVLKNKYDIIIGVRSAIFLPISDLSLIVVDEEHDTSFKQQDVAPRYNARDASTVLAKIHNAKVLLGSATPSFESYFAAKSEKYGFAFLGKRYNDAPLPVISLVNTLVARKCKAMRDEFTQTLVEAMQTALGRNEQILVFQNRRGYAPCITCYGCGWMPKCIDCSVNLTYHQLKNYLRCHYCGFYASVPSVCNECGSAALKNVGFGTEKLEESIKNIFPTKSVQRMDLETTRAKNSYEKIIQSIENHTVDIIVGTQMVAKGLDFAGIGLVGVMQVDRLLHIPDFRANEKCFQLITQVIGRAGRAQIPGSAIIQTTDPKNKTLKHIVFGDYDSLYNDEIFEREKYEYPPFVRLIKITLCHKDKGIAQDASSLFFSHLKTFKYIRLKGPIPAPVAKVRQMYLMEIWVKIPKDSGALSSEFKKKVQQIIAELSFRDKNFRATRVIFDVDPC